MNFPGSRSFTQRISRGSAVLAATLIATVTATLPAHAQTETLLYNFCSRYHCVDGDGPVGSLARDAKGNLYGTAEEGGVSNYGVVFKLTPQGKETVLYAFTGKDDGGIPSTGVVLDSNGNLDGFAPSGGAYGDGTVFSISPTGVETTLHAFDRSTGDGYEPVGPPVFDSAGNMYGVTGEGGAYGNGTLFKLTPDGTESILHSFGGMIGGNLDGELPEAGLTIDKNGNLYGTTDVGGSSNNGGVIFEYSAAGVYTVLANLSLTEGPSQPMSTLTIGPGRVLYGTSFTGGTDTDGTVYSVSPGAGGVWTVNTLYSFSSSVGDYPQSGVLLKNGVLYGTTYRNGEGAHGSLFSLTTGGTYTTLVNFSTDGTGWFPSGNLLSDAAGNLYGVAFEGGFYNGGAVYKVVP